MDAHVRWMSEFDVCIQFNLAYEQLFQIFAMIIVFYNKTDRKFRITGEM